jgi:hypothetical protein
MTRSAAHPAALMVLTVGDDHRSATDDEPDADHVELVGPSKRLGGHREHLMEKPGVADHGDARRPEPQFSDQAVRVMKPVEGCRWITKQFADTTERFDPTRSGRS